MPPKPKFTREDIISAALLIVSERGTEALTARELGNALESSARPIFTIFSGMDEVHEAVIDAAMEKFENFSESTLSDMPLFKQIGMRMILFAIHEPNLYKLIFMHENSGATEFNDIFGELGTTAALCIDTLSKDYELNQTDAKKLFENMWIYTFGIGTLCATGACRFGEERLSEMLSWQFSALITMIKTK